MSSKIAGAALGPLLLACAEPLETPAGRVVPSLTVEPVGAYGVGPAPRLRLSASGSAGLVPSELALFEGEISDAQVSRLRRRELPSALAAREVPALGWIDEASGELVARPERFLSPGLHTLVSLEFGRLGTFSVANDAQRLVRRFPPPGESGSGVAVLCGASTPVEGWAFSVEPALQRAELENDYGTFEGIPCVAVRFATVPGAPAVLPPEVEGHALDPEPYVALADEPLEGEADVGGVPSVEMDASVPDCRALAVGPLCAQVEDDRLNLLNAGDTLLLRAFGEGGAQLLVLPPGAPVALRGFAADTEYQLSGELIARSGTVTPFEARFRTAVARPRWVLNEVMADPLGREPVAEWVELVNASTVAADLSGFWLEDTAGRVELPPVLAAPGEFLLITREDFEGAAEDVPPAPALRRVLVPTIGGNGLSNAGEGLRLVDANGSVLSAFPSIASRHAGVSLARRSLDTADNDAAGFAEHGPPGASPGTGNTLATVE